jgi:hypothetical protein
MLKRLICLLSAGLVSAATLAEPEAPAPVTDQVYLSAGGHTEFYNQVQVDASGSLRRFGPAPTVGVGLKRPAFDRFLFLPELNWVLPRKSGEEIVKNLLMGRADLGYDPVDWFRLRLGTSIMWLNQHGSGGRVRMNNGNSTATFYNPEENRSSLNTTLDVGAELLLGAVAVRLQTYTYGAFRSERRQLSYTLFLSYYWDR